MTWIFLRLVRLYQIAISPLLGTSCRHEPTCSTYTYQAIERFGARRGTWLGIRRIARCRPGRPGGFDPVPQRDSRPGGFDPVPQRDSRPGGFDPVPQRDSRPRGFDSVPQRSPDQTSHTHTDQPKSDQRHTA
jgi:uncharacterized protein